MHLKVVCNFPKNREKKKKKKPTPSCTTSGELFETSPGCDRLFSSTFEGYGFPPQYGGAVGQQPYPMGQQATVTVQPTVYLTQGPLAHPVNDHLCYSIFTMLCCCLPLGIVALMYSISTRQANHIGNQMGAEHNSKWARILNHMGLGIGIGFTILIIIYQVVVNMY